MNALNATVPLALGVAIGWLDLQTTEVSVTILALLLAGLLLGLLQPKAVWRRALLLALGVPAMEVIALLLHLRTAEPIHLDPFVFLVVAALAFAGCYGGAGIRRMTVRRSTAA